MAIPEPPKRRRTNVSAIFLPITGLAAILVLWSGSIKLFDIQSLLLPKPSELAVLAALRALPYTTAIRKVLDALADRAFEFAAFTPLANATGQPAMSVPLYWNEAGLPIGVHFMARYGDEATLFRLAAQLEGERPWGRRRPAMGQ